MSSKTHLLAAGSGFPSTLCGRPAPSLFECGDVAEFLAIPPDVRCAQCASLARKGGLSDGGEKSARTGPAPGGQAPVRTAGVGTGDGVPARGGGVSQPVQKMSATALDGLDGAGCPGGAEAWTATDAV